MAFLELDAGVILGIDLGTTCTVAATLDARGRPVALANDLGEFSTPSVAHFESASAVLVGSAARNAAGLGSALCREQPVTYDQVVSQCTLRVITHWHDTLLPSLATHLDLL